MAQSVKQIDHLNHAVVSLQLGEDGKETIISLKYNTIFAFISEDLLHACLKLLIKLIICLSCTVVFALSHGEIVNLQTRQGVQTSGYCICGYIPDCVFLHTIRNSLLPALSSLLRPQRLIGQATAPFLYIGIVGPMVFQQQ